MMIGNPSRSTTVTEILYPIVRHCAIDALAIVCASSSVMFFWVTIPCALAGNDMAATAAKLTSVLEIGNMSELPTFSWIERAADQNLGLRAIDRDSFRSSQHTGGR